ncbi:hypothetical protein [Streptomyces sp. NPDC058295]|uniref:hypothetical protein n=1 Tax=Streptomyces sp. NPDC058295 TaxID=3346431 RepID=UPI0036EF8EA0
MSSSLWAVLLFIGVSAVYTAVDWWWGRWLRRRHGFVSPRRPKIYHQLAREAQERQVRLEGLGRSVNEVLAPAVDRVASLYDPTTLTEPPVDPWGEALLEDVARRHTLHHR